MSITKTAVQEMIENTMELLMNEHINPMLKRITECEIAATNKIVDTHEHDGRLKAQHARLTKLEVSREHTKSTTDNLAIIMAQQVTNLKSLIDGLDAKVNGYIIASAKDDEAGMGNGYTAHIDAHFIGGCGEDCAPEPEVHAEEARCPECHNLVGTPSCTRIGELHQPQPEPFRTILGIGAAIRWCDGVKAYHYGRVIALPTKCCVDVLWDVGGTATNWSINLFDVALGYDRNGTAVFEGDTHKVTLANNELAGPFIAAIHMRYEWDWSNCILIKRKEWTA